MPRRCPELRAPLYRGTRRRQHDAEAQGALPRGKAAFERATTRGVRAFKRAYVLSQRPELLFNMASALKERPPARRCRGAARYLRVVPRRPTARTIEQRILRARGGAELLDAEHAGSGAAFTATSASPHASPAAAPATRDRRNPPRRRGARAASGSQSVFQWALPR